MILMALTPPKVDYAKFNYFDVIVIVWLIIGLLRGRKRGMSQELLPTLQWLAIVIVGGMFYSSLSPLVHQYAQFGTLWSNITAYFLIAVGIHLIYLWFKQMLGTKLVEKDPFGRAEFYLGMISGVVRFACIMLVALSLMNSYVETAAELAQTEKFQKDNFSDIRFPTYGEFQKDVLFKSFTGNLVETQLSPVLLASVTTPKTQKKDSMAQKKNQEIDDILGSGKK
jgi:uncharacterized membrane protein required for colicin V production